LSDKDRLGVAVKTLLCRQCGTVRSGTALTPEGAEELYGSGLYRELFDEFGLSESERGHWERKKGKWLAANVQREPWCEGIVSEVGGFGGVAAEWMCPAAKEICDVNIERDAEFEALPPYPSDLILSVHVLEHFADPVATLREWAGHLSDTGRIVAVVPDLFAIHHNVTVKSTGDINSWWHFPHAWNWTRETVELPFLCAGLAVERVQFAPPGTLASVGSLFVTAKAADTCERVVHYLEEEG
jgi:SAM-dependent methyltransferase